MRVTIPPKSSLLTAAALLPFALLAGYAAVRWDVWSWEHWCGPSVAESPRVQAALHPVVVRFGLIAGAFVWCAALGILYAARHRGDGLLVVSGVNLIWPALAFCSRVPFVLPVLLGLAGGLYVTVCGLGRRRLSAPLFSLLANVAAIPLVCWFLWEGMVFAGD